MAAYGEYVGAPNGPTLLNFPQDYIVVEEGPRAARAPADLPSSARLAEYVEELSVDRRARAYLRKRGLNERTVRREGLGFDPFANAIVLPVYEGKRLVNVRRRYLAPWHKSKIKGIRGRPAALYPRPPKGRSVIVCAGEFDALVTSQNTRIATVTSTAGAGHWHAAWDRHFAGKRVAVIFDLGEQAAAEKRAEALCEVAGCDAWPVDIVPLLTTGKDLSDYWQQGGTSAALIAFITSERRRAEQ
jgi:hypothetical protein